jgi:NADPH2:quinone reductase
MFGQAALVASLQQHVVPLLGGPSGVRPVMDSQFELEEVAKAHSRLESRQHFGKTVLRVGGDGV